MAVSEVSEYGLYFGRLVKYKFEKLLLVKEKSRKNKKGREKIKLKLIWCITLQYVLKYSSKYLQAAVSTGLGLFIIEKCNMNLLLKFSFFDQMEDM